MPFEALSYKIALQFQDVPPQWAPLVFPFDPDLPLFPLLYFHVLANDLNGNRPAHGDRAFGYIRSVQIDLNTRVLSAEIICNKDLDAGPHAARFLENVTAEISHRLGLADRVRVADINNLFPANSQFADRIPVLREMWHRVVDQGYGGALPFGRLWDRVLGLARFYASFNPPGGGRKAEFIMTHYFCTRFGESIHSGAGVPAVDFYLLPTWEELTDAGNPLALFPKFLGLMNAASAMCALPHFNAYDLHDWSYTGVELPPGYARLNKDFFDHLVDQVGAQHTRSLRESFNAFNKGAHRATIFLMFLNDVRQLHVAAPMPAGAHHPRINPAALSSSDAADIFRNLEGAYQSKKVIAIYAQQGHANHHCIPVDTWIAAMLASPLKVAEYNRKSGTPRSTDSNLVAIAIFIAAGHQLGKAERLLWVAAQARKIHSTICNDALWCIKESGELHARSANPLACKACWQVIRTVCPAHAAIAQLQVGFNGTGGKSTPFNLITSSKNNTTAGQRFTVCKGRGTMKGLLDEDTAIDSGQSFNVPYPAPGHTKGSKITVAEFLNRY